MDINITFLKTFLTLCELKGFTKTAKSLHMTQPGVTQHIKWLEEHFKTNLLNRNGKSFELTVAGEKLRDYTEKLFKEHQSFEQSLLEDDPQSGECNFASPGSFGIKMYSFLLDLNKKYKNLKISYYYSPNITIESRLLSGKIDVGFMSIKPKDTSLNVKPLVKEKLLLVVPKKFKGESLEELNRLGYINHPDGKDMADALFYTNFKKSYSGFEKLKVSGENNQISRILEPVSLGLGYTVLPEYACMAFPKQQHLRYIALSKEVFNTIYVVTKKYKTLPSRYDFILEQFSASLSQ